MRSSVDESASGQRLLRGVGWAVVLVALSGLLVALGTSWWLLPSSNDPPRRLAAVGLLHAFAWRPLAAGLVGPVLLFLGRGRVPRSAAGVIAGGALLAAAGGVLAGTSGPGATFLVGQAVAAVGWGLGGLGVLAVVVTQRRWLSASGAALAVGAVHTVGDSVLVLVQVTEAWALLGDPSTVWMTVTLAPTPVLVWLLAAGAVMDAFRAPDSPVDRWAWLPLAAVVAADLVAPGSSGSLWPVRAGLAVAVAGAVAYAIDGVRRGALRPRSAQPFALAGVVLWALGALALGALHGSDVFLHDTYAELGPVHLLGPLLVCVVALGVALRATSGPWPWALAAMLAWPPIVASVVLLGAFHVLGAEGMPRRAYSYGPMFSEQGASLWLAAVAVQLALLLAGVGAAGLRATFGPAGAEQGET